METTLPTRLCSYGDAPERLLGNVASSANTTYQRLESKSLPTGPVKAKKHPQGHQEKEFPAPAVGGPLLTLKCDAPKFVEES